MGPQCEDGFTKIANELLDALCRIRIPGESMQVFLTILRKTYGFGKKEDRISITQIMEATGIPHKGHIARALDKLVTIKVVTKKGNGSFIRYGINKHHYEWLPFPKKGTILLPFPKKGTMVPQKGNDIVPQKGNNKRKKETYTKEILSSSGDEVQVDVWISKKKRKLDGKRLETFKLFWEAFNYKSGRAEAIDSWLDIPQLTMAMVDKIVQAAAREAKARTELIKQGRTPKMAQGWLTARRWEDEAPIVASTENSAPVIPPERSNAIRRDLEKYDY